MCRRPSGSRWGRGRIRCQSDSSEPSAIDIHTAISSAFPCPTRFSPANGARSGSMTSSASAASRRRCATPSPRSASRSRSSSPARAASARPRRRASWRAALNCEQGPTADPCGVCDACVEIAAGPRHRRPRDRRRHQHAGRQGPRRHHRRASAWRRSATATRSSSSTKSTASRAQAFDALLKSIEEPPPHVVFMMATTEIEKVPADDPVAVAGVRAEGDRRQADRRSAAADRRRRADRRSTRRR